MTELNELREKTEETTQPTEAIEPNKITVPEDVLSLSPHEQVELRDAILNDESLSHDERSEMLTALRKPYKEMTKAQLLQTVRDFQAEYGREPKRDDLIYQDILKQKFGPWSRMLEAAGTRPVSEIYKQKRKNRRKKRVKQRRHRAEVRARKTAERENITFEEAMQRSEERRKKEKEAMLAAKLEAQEKKKAEREAKKAAEEAAAKEIIRIKEEERKMRSESQSIAMKRLKNNAVICENTQIQRRIAP